MLLMDIKKLLIERGQISQSDLAKHFYLSESAVASMMSHWIKKGKVEEVDLSGSCGSGCGSCSEATELSRVYRWRQVAQKPIAVNSK